MKLKTIVGYGLAVLAGLAVLKFVFGAIWGVVKVAVLVLAVGGVLWGVRRLRLGRR